MTKSTRSRKARYKVLRELAYPPERRVAPGEIVDDIPEISVPWLLRDGLIEPVAEEVTDGV